MRMGPVFMVLSLVRGFRPRMLGARSCGIRATPERLRKERRRRAELTDAVASERSDDGGMIPLSDGLFARRFPFVNVALIVANFAVWLFYELPHLDSSISRWSFYPCTVNGSCHGPEPWGLTWISS